MADTAGADLMDGVTASGTQHQATTAQNPHPSIETQQDNAAQASSGDAVEGHLPMANRLSLVSWGDESSPSLPSVDSNANDDSDRDSAMGTLRSSTASLRTSIYDYVEENGRTYHRYKEGKYPLPNDALEQERLDIQHALFVVTSNGKLYLAPLDKNIQHVLDIATGTGIWAIEFAQDFPNAQVLGTDLSPIQPDYIPPNVRFEIDDAEDEWTFAVPFDYIHGRALLSCFTDPSVMIRKAFHALAPGGYLELQDAYFPLSFASPPPPDSALDRWARLCAEGAAKSGRPWTNALKYAAWMREIGFVDVVEKRFYWPTNGWAKGAYFKTVGRYFMEDLLNGLEAISFKVLGVLGWGIDEINPFLELVRKELRDPNIHGYLNILYVYGRKPGSRGGAPPTLPEAAEMQS